MKQLFTFLLAAFTSSAAYCQTHININDVSKHVGDSVNIGGMVFSGIYLPNVKGSPTFINMGNESNKQLLLLIVYKNVRSQFFEAPDVYLRGKTVEVKGKITLYKGKPAIILYRPNQLKEVAKDEIVYP